MLSNFIAAFALMLVFEGILPFLSPDKYRDFSRKISQQNDRVLRMMGLISMVVGAAALAVLHTWFY